MYSGKIAVSPGGDGIRKKKKYKEEGENLCLCYCKLANVGRVCQTDFVLTR
jgi:hypothetical protein